MTDYKLTILRPFSTRKIKRIKGTAIRMGTSFMSLPSSPNLKRNVFHTRKKNQKIRDRYSSA